MGFRTRRRDRKGRGYGRSQLRRLDGGFYRRGGGGRLSRHRFRFAGKEDGGSDCAEDQEWTGLFFSWQDSFSILPRPALGGLEHVRQFYLMKPPTNRP